MGRKRILFEVEHHGTATPSKEVIKNEVIKLANSSPELVSVKHIYTNFGQQKSKVIANIYEDEKTLKFLETPKGKKVKAEVKK